MTVEEYVEKAEAAARRLEGRDDPDGDEIAEAVRGLGSAILELRRELYATRGVPQEQPLSDTTAHMHSER